MSEATAIVFDIEKFAVHDGPGIRTVVFLKGCPLRCIWCHNPESQSFEPEVLFDSAKCTRCGSCAAVCPENCHRLTDAEHAFARDRCRRCGRCMENCPTGALKLAGREMSVSEVLTEVLRDEPFYRNSGGGLTLSGGEPLAHYAFTAALLEAAKQTGLHTAVETSGFAPWEHIEALLPVTDLWLWDVKAAPDKHEELTGVPAGPILENLAKLDASGAAIVLRCPLVPGVNDDETALRHIADTTNKFTHVRQIDLEPYHPLGEGKGRELGRSEVFHADFASADDKKRWCGTLAALTRTPVRCY